MIKKLAYSFGAIATALSQSLSTYVIFFYVDVMKLPASLAVVGGVAYAVWNAISEPIVGYVSDHTRTRWGRRIPYIAAGAIPLGILYFLIWVPPFEGHRQIFPLFAYFIALISLFAGFYAITILNWTSLYPEMYPSLKERAEVNAYRQGFGMLGLVVGIALPPLIYNRWGWGWMGAMFGIMISLSLLIALWGSHERKEFSLDRPLPLRVALKTMLGNRTFFIFVFANLFVQYTLTQILVTFPFFAKYILNAKPFQTTLILAVAFLTALPTLFIWKRLALKYGTKRCYMASMFMLVIFLTPFLFAKSFKVILLTSAFVGSCLAGFILNSDVIISDMIDEDEVNTGGRREGIFFGMMIFIARFAIGLQVLTMSSVFILSRYNPHAPSQPLGFLFGLRLLIAGFPIIALIFGFAIMKLYPLSGKKLEELKIKLAEVHAMKIDLMRNSSADD